MTWPARAPVIDQAVVRERVQPGRELRGRHIARADANRIHPHILEQLVGDAGVAAVAQQIAIDAALVPRVQRVERGGVARAVGEHQLLVARRPVRAGHGPPSMQDARRRATTPARMPLPSEPSFSDADRARNRIPGNGFGSRRAMCGVRLRQHAHRDQVLAAVVLDRDGLRGRARRALEAASA